ncbi:MAG: zf-HC2 domain-containing protein, partial [Candidatus Aminicenantes bacterium]|nr:zf-HC2 domain-containing protein [Candidatus Aminicenantes bacterium]
MRHKTIIDSLGAFLDGELNQKQINIIKKHLNTCAECRKELESLKSLNDYSREVFLEAPEYDDWNSFSERIILKINRNKKQTRTKEEKMFKDSFIKGNRYSGSSAVFFPLSVVVHAFLILILLVYPLINTTNLPQV